MLTKQSLLWLILVTNVIVFLFLINFSISNSNLYLQMGIFILITLNLYYFTNNLHQASHRLFSKNKYLNYFAGFLSGTFCLLSFSEFTFTHLQHHQNVNKDNKDPDHVLLQKSGVLLLPFFIWYKDTLFLKANILNSNFKLIGAYFFERFVQLTLFVACIYIFRMNNLSFAFSFLLPLLTVGYLNTFFLFYFPHYRPNWELKLQQSNPISVLINISRYYHALHHEKIRSVQAYFPLEMYFFKLLLNQPKLPKVKLDVLQISY
jgi:fatty acid desaturase